MDHHQMARMIAVARMIAGIALLVAPGAVTRRLLGPGAGSAEAKLLARAAGARDVALGLGTLQALASGDDATGWVAGSAAVDASDALGAAIGFGRRQPLRALLMSGLGASSALAGLRAARELAES